jgi:hypothetical protein
MKNKSGLFGLSSPMSSFTRACAPAKLAGLALIASAALVSSSSAAVVLEFNTNVGSNDPVGQNPWLTLTFEDLGVLDSNYAAGYRVKATLATKTGASSGLTADEFVSGVWFNTKSTNKSFVDGLSTGTNYREETNPVNPVGSSTFSSLLDGLGQGGQTGFDFHLDLPTSGDRLVTPESFVFYLKGVVSGDFEATTDSGGYYAFARVQGIGTNNAGSARLLASVGDDPNLVVIPEPGSTAALMGLLSCGLFLRSRRCRKA